MDVVKAYKRKRIVMTILMIVTFAGCFSSEKLNNFGLSLSNDQLSSIPIFLILGFVGFSIYYYRCPSCNSSLVKGRNNLSHSKCPKCKISFQNES